PDAELRAGALEILEAYLRDHPKVGIVVPRLVNPDGSVQHNARTFPTPWTMLARRTFLGLLPIFRGIRARHVLEDSVPNVARPIPVARRSATIGRAPSSWWRSTLVSWSGGCLPAPRPRQCGPSPEPFAALLPYEPMKGLVLAGGTATRLFPLTIVTNKHLLPIYYRPLIYYPIETLAGMDINEVMVVVGGKRVGDVV